MIYLIRHGKTEANEKHLYCGSRDISLSDLGKKELGRLSYKVRNPRFFTSGMKRTNETLKVLFGDVKYKEVPDLKEIDFGAFEMKSYDELKDNPEYIKWISGDNEANTPPAGESGKAMKARVMPAFYHLQSLDVPGEDIVIITHGGVIAGIMETLFPEEGKNLYEWQPVPGHGYAVADGGYREIPSNCE